MGRKKIEIKPIEDARRRHVTFHRRKLGLMKKAYELGILCDCDVGLMIFAQNKKMCLYSSQPMDDMVTKYREFTEEFPPTEALTNADLSSSIDPNGFIDASDSDEDKAKDRATPKFSSSSKNTQRKSLNTPPPLKQSPYHGAGEVITNIPPDVTILPPPSNLGNYSYNNGKFGQNPAFNSSNSYLMLPHERQSVLESQFVVPLQNEAPVGIPSQNGSSFNLFSQFSFSAENQSANPNASKDFTGRPELPIANDSSQSIASTSEDTEVRQASTKFAWSDAQNADKNGPLRIFGFNRNSFHINLPAPKTMDGAPAPTLPAIRSISVEQMVTSLNIADANIDEESMKTTLVKTPRPKKRGSAALGDDMEVSAPEAPSLRIRSPSTKFGKV